MKRPVKYVGEDREFVALLENNSRTSCWSWTEFKSYTNLASYLRCAKQSRFPGKSWGGGEFRSWMRHRFAPVVLDLDFDQAGATDVIHNLRQIDGGVPLIVTSRLSSMNAYSILKIDGADGFCTKSRHNLDGLMDAIEEAFDKIDRWERTLLQFSSTPEMVEHHE